MVCGLAVLSRRVVGDRLVIIALLKELLLSETIVNDATTWQADFVRTKRDIKSRREVQSPTKRDEDMHVTQNDYRLLTFKNKASSLGCHKKKLPKQWTSSGGLAPSRLIRNRAQAIPRWVVFWRRVVFSKSGQCLQRLHLNLFEVTVFQSTAWF